MNRSISSHILSVFGPCRVLLVGFDDGAPLADLLLYGCDAWAADPVRPLDHPRCLTADQTLARPPDVLCVRIPPALQAENLLEDLFQRFGQPTAGLILQAGGQHRRRLDNALFSEGWRRHPADLDQDGYPHFDDTRLHDLATYQPLPEAAGWWSLRDLEADRGLHMDMLRESGCRADAHIVRYALAARYIRPGDTVLDCACGLGYGTAVMAAQSQAARFIGIELDAATVAYAAANYLRPNMEFRQGNAERLEEIPDASVDVVVSMETVEHVADWQAALRTFRRILKPDGRLIASVPDNWVDETGRDPNPHHLHAFNWRKFSDELSSLFIVEKRYVQAAPGGFKLPQARRVLQEVPQDARIDAEWLIAVAAVNPLEDGQTRRDDYRHPACAAALTASGGATVADFKNGYDNPYLYRSLVQMGERISDPDRLWRLALLAAETVRSGSADQGAALCVLAYRVLEKRDATSVAAMLEHITAFMTASEDVWGNPHVLRWRLSLCFVAGRLAELAGDRPGAIVWFRQAAEADWQSFSPLLATKAIAACFHQGALHLADGRDRAARDSFAKGVALGTLALSGDARRAIGHPAQPIPFAFQELAEVADMASQCANALTALPLLMRDRGLFWRQLDLRRFGLATWAQDVEQANRELAARLRQLEQARR